MATGSISQFLTSFTGELARPNHYDVDIVLPSGLSSYGDFSSRTLKLRCEATELPGRSLLTGSMKVYGVEEKFPYLSNFNDIALTFIVTDSMDEKRIFEYWLNFIHPTSTFNFKYKNEYATEMRITQYDLKNKESYRIRLLNAYPVGTNSLELSWASDGYHKLTVSFVYDKWEEVSSTREGVNEIGQMEINREQSNIPSLTKNEIVYQGKSYINNTEDPNNIFYNN